MTDAVDRAVDRAELARCMFYLRTRAEGGYRYERLQVEGPGHVPSWPTRFPPHVGDLIELPGGTYLVLARSAKHPEYGSKYWPHNASAPVVGPMLNLIVVPDRGLFADEVED